MFESLLNTVISGQGQSPRGFSFLNRWRICRPLAQVKLRQIFLEQLAALRLPVMFESLLSTHGDESAMLEDMWGVLQHINSIRIKVCLMGIL